jgi:hyperosmotically inducible protein
MAVGKKRPKKIYMPGDLGDAATRRNYRKSGPVVIYKHMEAFNKMGETIALSDFLQLPDARAKDVVEGEVQLQGIVDTLKEKEWAEDLVRQVSGVKGVANAVSISTDGSITDDEIIQEVQEELEGDPDGNLFNIGVGSVNRGKVVLAGRSNDPAEIEAAVKAASKARGVTEVISQVKQESGEDALTPEEIFHSQVNNDEE